MSATLLVSPYLALKFWISSPGDGLTPQSSSENVKFPTHNSYLSSTKFAKKKKKPTCSSFKFSIYQ
jgi:hypothetical protein